MASEMNANSGSRLPDWVSIPIILICLVGGGLIIRWYLLTDPASHESKITAKATTPAKQSNPTQGVGGNQRVARKVRGTVKAGRNGSWSVHVELANADFSVANGKASLGVVVYNSYAFVPGSVKSTITGVRTIIYDNDRIALLALSPQQVAELRALNERITMNLSSEDRDQLCKAMLAYAQAGERDRPNLEAALEQSLDEVAQRSTTATLQQAQDRAAQINAIITPEMWKLNSSIGNGK